MTPDGHLRWFEDNIVWFERLDVDSLSRPVPGCPGWTVTDVINHLSFGLGRSYPVALSAAPDTPDAEVFATVERPRSLPGGMGALEVFGQLMRECLAVFRATDPDRPAWTYGGAGVACFWFRRAAIETALHRIDVVEAVATGGPGLATERAVDGVIEAVTFALPLAARTVGQPGGDLSIVVPEADLHLRLDGGTTDAGVDSAAATLSGPAEAVLLTLWGRSSPTVAIGGDQSIADAWLSCVERAFAGR